MRKHERGTSGSICLTRDLGFLRIAAVAPRLRVGDVEGNARAIIEYVRLAADEGVQVLAFPEMAISGYTIADLVHHEVLLGRVREALRRIVDESASTGILVTLGLPLAVEHKVFNCAAVLASGRILGVVPKAYLPAYREFYEDRWFAPGGEAHPGSISLLGQEVPFGTDLLFRLGGPRPATVGVEICEDLWVPLSPHEYQAVAGATVLVNLSASNEVIGKAQWRRTMITSESGRCLAALCYVSAGRGESTNDVVFGGHIVVAENGTILGEADRLTAEPRLVTADVDLDRLAHDRRVATTFGEGCRPSRDFRTIDAEAGDPAAGPLHRVIDPHPFVPGDPAERGQRCREVFSMQVSGLAGKLNGAGRDHVVLGVSGGLDSTLAVLVAAGTMDYLKLPRRNVHACSLPGFGTTRRTRSNAAALCRALGVELETVDITRSCRSHLRDLKHAGEEDVVFENVQARYRTEFLFNKANETGAVVLGTGDLTEIALGWCTFSGDHLSHYHVNASVPKTLVRFLVRWVADEETAGSPAKSALYDILDTPISPELRRPEKGRVTQKTEEAIGPVELADFYLYPFIRWGMRPGKILYLADEVRRRGLFEGRYTLSDLHRWLRSFLLRFFANQFKRTCLPEGPKVGSVSLSPRGDWRMPSDAEAGLWIEDLEETYERLREQHL